MGRAKKYETLWVFGDQLHPDGGVLRDASPDRHVVLLVESAAKLQSKRWHRQRAHLVVTGLRRLAQDLRDRGFEVDYCVADSLPAGLAAHRKSFAPTSIKAMSPMSYSGVKMLERNNVTVVPNDQFLCSPELFREWKGSRKQLKLEDFYRWQRKRLGYLMDGDQPAGGTWNFDHDNREPPPTDGRSWPEPLRTPLDEHDREVLAALPDSCWGAEPDGTWATSRGDALRRLRYAIDVILPKFGPHEDAMLSTNWHLAHTLLSPYLNLGMIHPREVADEVETAYRSGLVPIASAEGFLRQVIGWREYVWGFYWDRMPTYRLSNSLDAHRPLPPLFTGGEGSTQMRCVSSVLRDVDAYGWTHHIQRLMVLGNLALLAGVEPNDMVEWMWESFVDGAEWVMLPNVLGMSLFADGGLMATKPYAGGGAYIDRMSDYCKGCCYDRKSRVGEKACPFTTLYWHFLDRHADRFSSNIRIVQQVRAAQKLSDLDAVRERGDEVLSLLDAGQL